MNVFIPNLTYISRKIINAQGVCLILSLIGMCNKTENRYYVFFRDTIPCNGGEAARYDDTADGPVVRVTGSGQRYTLRVGCGSHRQHKIFSLFTRTKTPLNANGQHRYDPMIVMARGGFSILFYSFKTFNEFILSDVCPNYKSIS